MSLVVGVDIGGTSVEAVVADEGNRVIGRARRSTDAQGAEAVLVRTFEVIREALTAAGADGIAGIGIGVPGHVDADTGMVRHATNLAIDQTGLPIGPRVRAEFGTSVVVENDVRAAAVGAFDLLRRDAPDLRTLAYLSIGTGVSAGLVVDGEVHRGRDGVAGEIGHVVMAADGPACRCGLRGCLEALVAGPAIARRWPAGGSRPAEDLFRSAADGVEAARVVADEVAGHVSQAVQWLAAAYGPDLVALGGGVGSIGGPLLSAIRARLAAYAAASEVAARVLEPERVVAMPPNFPAGAIGAAVLARRAGRADAVERRDEGGRTEGMGNEDRTGRGGAA